VAVGSVPTTVTLATSPSAGRSTILLGRRWFVVVVLVVVVVMVAVLVVALVMVVKVDVLLLAVLVLVSFEELRPKPSSVVLRSSVVLAGKVVSELEFSEVEFSELEFSELEFSRRPPELLVMFGVMLKSRVLFADASRVLFAEAFRVSFADALRVLFAEALRVPIWSSVATGPSTSSSSHTASRGILQSADLLAALATQRRVSELPNELGIGATDRGLLLSTDAFAWDTIKLMLAEDMRPSPATTCNVIVCRPSASGV